jgi:hypothetical protein
MRNFEKTVSQGAFTVIYMSNDAKISDILHSFANRLKVRCKSKLLASIRQLMVGTCA